MMYSLVVKAPLESSEWLPGGETESLNSQLACQCVTLIVDSHSPGSLWLINANGWTYNTSHGMDIDNIMTCIVVMLQDKVVSSPGCFI